MVAMDWGELVAPGPTWSLMSNQAVSHLPKDCTVGGVMEQLLACAGYTPEEVKVTHEQRGEMPSSFAARLRGGVMIRFAWDEQQRSWATHPSAHG